jgi:hypothetical protein
VSCSHREKLALDYAVAVMRTPVEVTDELFAQIKEHFSEKQLVELTALLTLVNLNRFNAAFGIGSAGFSNGMVTTMISAIERARADRASLAHAARSSSHDPGPGAPSIPTPKSSSHEER